MLRSTVSAVVLWAALAVLMLAVAVPAFAGQTIVGEQMLTANGGLPTLTGQNIPVFQGAASSNYVLTSPQTGVITSWSFMSAGAEPGTPYLLRVLAPAGAGKWRAVATSRPVQVTSPSGVDEKNGPFIDSIPIDAGDAIAIQPTNADGDSPVESGISGMDGIRYFSRPFEDGSVEEVAPGSDMNNGQVVPIQATVEFSEAPPGPVVQAPIPLHNTAPPTISGVAKSGSTLSCSPGTWSAATPPTFTYRWFWDGSDTIPKIRLTAKAPVFGVPRHTILPGAKSYLETIRVPLASSQSIVVPDLPATGSTFVCLVTATAGPQSVSAQTAPDFILPTPPRLAMIRHGARASVERPPMLTRGVGVGGTNVCTHGEWTGYPTRYTYAWFRVRPARERDQLLQTGQRYMPTPDDEEHKILCVVTATNKGGSSTASTGAYKVQPDAPVPTQPPFVEVHTIGPTSAPGLIGPEGGAVTAEQIHLGCGTGRWNRGDLTFTTAWTLQSAYGGEAAPLRTEPLEAGPSAAAGSELDFDMRPGDLQYSSWVQCEVIARTRHGVSSWSLSGSIEIWNGCYEKLEGKSGEGTTIGSTDLLEALPIVLTGPAAGLAGLFDVDVGTLGHFGIGIPEFSLFGIEVGEEEYVGTYGPNCGAYRAYFEGLGYTVKQEN